MLDIGHLGLSALVPNRREAKLCWVLDIRVYLRRVSDMGAYLF